MSSSPPHLPVITFPKEISGWKEVSSSVVSALENHGCFMAKWETLLVCHQDLSKKIIKKLPNVSYELEFDYKTKPVLPDPLPSTTEDMRKAILGYAQTAGVLEQSVRKMVFDHYKLPKESTGYKFQMKKYKKEVILGCSDQEFLAVLDLKQVNGLEMKKDRQWFSIDVKPSTFLIMAGKPLTGWSKRKINPPELLVRVHGNEEKYSVGLFAYYDKKGKDKDPKKPVGRASRS